MLQPLAPYEQPVSLLASTSHAQKEQDEAASFVQNLANIHGMVHDSLI
jgi:hypothetical protein